MYKARNDGKLVDRFGTRGYWKLLVPEYGIIDNERGFSTLNEGKAIIHRRKYMMADTFTCWVPSYCRERCLVFLTRSRTNVMAFDSNISDCSLGLSISKFMVLFSKST